MCNWDNGLVLEGFKKEKGMKGVKKILKHIEDVCYGIFTIFISCVHLLLSCCQYIFWFWWFLCLEGWDCKDPHVESWPFFFQLTIESMADFSVFFCLHLEGEGKIWRQWTWNDAVIFASKFGIFLKILTDINRISSSRLLFFCYFFWFFCTLDAEEFAPEDHTTLVCDPDETTQMYLNRVWKRKNLWRKRSSMSTYLELNIFPLLKSYHPTQ